MGHLISLSLKRLCLVGILFILIGCVSNPLRKESISYKYHLPAPTPNVYRTKGSLWDDGNSRNHLFVDHRARNVGDTITITIVESSSASNEANTKTGRGSTYSAEVKGFFGAPIDAASGFPYIWPEINEQKYGFKPSVSATVGNKHDGSGKTTRKGALSATISGQVVEVLPNGNLVIEGRRELTVNNERQFIVLSGIIRPKDISDNNVVLSTAIANAKIEFTGKGVLTDQQRPGWMARFLDLVWPF